MKRELRLKDIATHSKGKQINGNELVEDGKYKYLNGGINPSGRWNEYNVAGDTVTISEGGNSSGYVNYIEEPFWCGAHCYYLYNVKGNSKYLYYALKSSQKLIMNLRTGAAMPNLKKSTLGEFSFVYDSDATKQNEVVQVLERVELIIKHRSKQLIDLDNLIKSRFVEMFGDPEVNPYGWEKAPLSRIIKYANNGMARRGNDEKGNIVIRLVELRDSFIDYSSPNRILLEDNEKERYLLKDKDFLFARVNGNPDNVGRCAIFNEIDEEVYHNDHIIRVHFKEDILDGNVASILINSPYGKRQLKTQIKTSAGQYTVSQEGIGSIMSIIPPIELQNQFADFAKQIDKLKLIVQKSLDETQELFKSLMQEYFG